MSARAGRIGPLSPFLLYGICSVFPLKIGLLPTGLLFFYTFCTYVYIYARIGLYIVVWENLTSKSVVLLHSAGLKSHESVEIQIVSFFRIS